MLVRVLVKWGEDWVGGGYYDVVPLLLLHLLLSSNQNPQRQEADGEKGGAQHCGASLRRALL